MKTNLHLTLCVIAILRFTLTRAIQINFVKIPSAVKNNTGHPVILDCNYSVRPDDSDLVVKWFLNGDVVYQWIPPQKPQSLGIMKDRIDLSYEATDDPKTVYRAMKILNPTSDIAGEYKCHVSTFADEDFGSRNMIVFEPERDFIIEVKSNKSSVNFTCRTNEIYPAPKLILNKDKKDDFYNKNPLQTLQWDTTLSTSGKYNAFIVATSPIKRMNPGTLVHCELRIPGTGYVKKKSFVYYPQEDDQNSGKCLGPALDSFQFAALLILSQSLTSVHIS